MSQEFKIIEIHKVQPSKKNYRKTFDKKALIELTTSVKSKGVLQPLVVRPLNGNGTYEIVAGHRRHQAALAAELKTIPCMIHDLSDEDALEIQVIENTHRENPNLMEEAQGFKLLLELGKHTAETLAEKLNKSTDYVYRRLRLCSLPKKAQDKLLSGELSLGHALLILRLHNETEQKEFLKDMLDDDMTVKEAAYNVQSYSHKLDKAVFNIEACETCEYLSGNQTALFPELKKSDDCMDRSCYFKKTLNHYTEKADEYKANGFKVLTDGKAVEPLKHAKNSCMIAAPDASYYADKPKRYKTACMKCTEHHAFYFYKEKRHYGDGDVVEFGEICLNKKCLIDMNNPKAAQGNNKESESPAKMNSYTAAIHARDCRDRFLRQRLFEELTITNKNATQALRYMTINDRLIIHTLLTLYKDFDGRTEIIQKYYPKYKKSPHGYEDSSLIYKAILAVEQKHLASMKRDVFIGTLNAVEPLVLLLITPEAGIDMQKEWGPDEIWLKTKTKDELKTFAEKQGLKITITATSKKGDLIKQILEHELAGKLSEDLSNVLKLKEEINVDSGEEPCIKCGKTWDEDFENEDDAWDQTPEGPVCPDCAAG